MKNIQKVALGTINRHFSNRSLYMAVMQRERMSEDGDW